MKPEYMTRAARDAFPLYGKKYADYIETSTLVHIVKGNIPVEIGLTMTLSDALEGNDGE